MTATHKTDDVIPRRRASDWQAAPDSIITPDQLGILLNDIALMARNIDRFAAMLVSELGREQEKEASYLAAIEVMAQRIGWASDMAAKRMKCPFGPVFGAAQEWMMPSWGEPSEGRAA